MMRTAVERIAHWQDAQALIDGYPVRRVWEIFNKMLVDRQKFILGSWFPWGGSGFLMRMETNGYQAFVAYLVHTFNYMCGLYPPYPAESGLPLLNSFSNILQYGSRKYPELHKSISLDFNALLNLSEYKPEEFYKTAAAGGDDEYAFINQNQLFGKLWNLLHYFGGVCIDLQDYNIRVGSAYQTGNPIQFWEDEAGRHSHYDGGTSARGSGMRFFYTPTNNLEYKYLCIAELNSGSNYDASYSGIIQYSYGINILYESDWIRGIFTSPWIKQAEPPKNHSKIEFVPHLFVYPHFPDFYDPDTLEPIYFQ